MNRFSLAALLALTVVPYAAIPLAAQQPGARPPQPAAPVNPAMVAAENAFQALPEATRRQIQDDLIWASNFTATTSGSFGRRTYDAILNFQRLARVPVNGILDAGQIRTLAEVAARTRASVKLTMQADPRTGARVPVAGALFVKRETLPTGTRWESADGAVVLETGVGKGGADELPAAFDRFLNLEAPGRRVTYKLLRPDFFVVSGEIGPRSFYVRYAVGPNNLRGYALSYPTRLAGQMERHVIAIANGFEAVPGQAAAVATAAPAAGAGGPPVVAAPPVNPNTIQPGLILTGVVVAPGRIATAPLAAACADLRVNGKPARLAAPAAPGQPVLLEADTAAAQPLAGVYAVGAQANLVVLGFAPGPRPVLSVSTGDLIAASDTAPRIAAPLQREGGGSLVLDRRGQIVGLMVSPKQAPRLVAGFVPAASHAMLPAKTAFPGLDRSASLRPEISTGEIAAMYARALLPVTCGQPVTLP